MRDWLTRCCWVLGLTVSLTLFSLGSPVRAEAQGFETLPAVAPSGTPDVGDGQVNAVVRVGSTVILGGSFTAVSPATGGSSVPRTNLAAYDAATGVIHSTFAPNLNAEVQDLEPGPEPGTVYASGRFSRVNGEPYNKVVLLDVATGEPIPSFRASAANGVVNSMALSGGRLYIGGWFRTVGGASHGGLAALDPLTGKVDSYMANQVDENHNNTGSGAVGPVGVRELDVTPAGDRLVAIGNFRKVDGQDRDQVVMLTLGPTESTVTGDWQTNRYKPLCFSWSFDHYVRGVDFSPDGSYFVVGTTGGYNSGTLCDAAARFETYSSGTGLEPTWVDYTGGDTLWAVAVTEAAVFVGGHQRWMNNSLASDRAGAGAVPRPGLAALSTESGLPLKWNPGRNPRGAAVFDIYADSDGLYIGSDTDWIGDFEHHRGKIAHFPLQGGVAESPDTTPEVPGSIFVGGNGTLAAAEFDGTTVGPLAAADPMAFGWHTARGAFLAGGYLYYGATDGGFYRRTFTGSELGAPESITPWADPVWSGIPTGSGRRNYDGLASGFYAQIPSLTSLAYADGRIYYTRSNDTGLYSRWFNVDSGVVGADEVRVSASTAWRSVSSTFVTGDTFYYVSSANGGLYSLPLQDAVGGGPVPSGSLVSNQNFRGTAFLSSDAAVSNDAPVAGFEPACAELQCSFDASSSVDPDGTVESYAWDFGDGSTADGSLAEHAYTAPGTYTVTLTVIDNLGTVNSVSKDVTVVDITNAAISHVGAAASALNSPAPDIQVPSEVNEGDTLLLTAAISGDFIDPGLDGWALVDRRETTGMTTFVWTKRATAADAASTVTFELPSRAKTALTVSAYRGANAVNPVGAYATAVSAFTADHVSPQLEAPPDSMVVTVWSDKGPSTSDWTEPVDSFARAEAISSGTGRVSTLVADGGGAQAGPVGNLTATTDAESSRGVSWTIALVP